LLHQTLGRGEDGSDLIGWAGRPKVTLEVDRDARTRPLAQLARSPTARAANVKPSGFVGAVISFPLHRRAVCEFRLLQRSSTSVRAKGPGEDARCRPLSRERRRSHMTSVFSASPTLIQGRRPAGRCRSSGQLADFRRRSALGRLHTDHTAPYRMAVITERAALRAIISTLNPRLGRYVEAASRRTKSCVRAKSVRRRAPDA